MKELKFMILWSGCWKNSLPDTATPTKDSSDANSNATSNTNNAKNPAKTSSPKTGDSNNLALWLIQ